MKNENRSPLWHILPATTLLCLAVAALAMTTAQAQGWNMPGGGPTHQGAAPQISSPLSLDWAFSTGSTNNNPSTPVSDGENIYLASGSKLVAVSLDTGGVIASYSGEAEFFSTPAIARNKLFIGTDKGELIAFSIPDLTPAWKFSIEPLFKGEETAIQSSPLVVETEQVPLLYFGSDNGKLYCLAAKSANWDRGYSKLWEFPTLGVIKASPAYSDGVVFFTSFDGYAYALDALTGTLKWSRQTRAGASPFTRPTLGLAGAGLGGYGGYGTGGYGLGGYGAGGYGTGAYGTGGYGYPSGTYPQYGSTYPGGTYPYSGANPYGTYPGAGSTGYAYPRTGTTGATTGTTATTAPTTPEQAVQQAYLNLLEQIKQSRPNYYMYASPVVADTFVYVTSASKLFALDRKTGTLRWMFEADGFILGDPAISQRQVAFATNAGAVYCLSANDGKQVWSYKNPQPEPFSSSVTIAGNAVVARSSYGNLYLFDLEDGKLLWQYKMMEPKEKPAAKKKTTTTATGTPAATRPTAPAGGYPYYGGTTPYGGAAGLYGGTAGLYGGTAGLYGGAGGLYGGTPGLYGGAGGLYGSTGLYGAGGLGGAGGLYGTSPLARVSQEELQGMIELKDAEEVVTSAPIVAGDKLIAWGNDGMLYSFSHDVSDTNPPQIVGAFLEVPVEDGDVAYRLPVSFTGGESAVSVPGKTPIHLAFWVFDTESGINPDSISVLINGEKVEHDFYPDEGTLWYTFPRTYAGVSMLPDDTYECTVKVSDWFANETEVSVAFTVDNSLPTPKTAATSSRTTGTRTSGTAAGSAGTGAAAGGSTGAAGGTATGGTPYSGQGQPVVFTEFNNMALSSQALNVPLGDAGTVVVWRNNDSVTHDVTAEDGSFSSGPIAPGKTWDHVFTELGTYNYYCSIHPNEPKLRGAITLLPPEYFTE